MTRYDSLGTATVLPLLLGSAGAARGQDPGQANPAHRDLRGRHAITLSMGLLPDVRTSPLGSGEHGVSTRGVLGGIGYAYWPVAEWNVEVGVTGHAAETTTVRAATVTSLLFDAATRTRSVVGARLAGGVDAFPARWLRLGLRAGYHLAPDYDAPVGPVRGPAGPELSFMAGIVFGGRR
jgi:hypothetical protein